MGKSQQLEHFPLEIYTRYANKLEMLSEEIRRETVRQGGWRKRDWQGKVVVVLAFGVPRDMTRKELKRECDEVGMYCFAIGKVDGEGEQFPSHAETESEHGMAEDRDRKSVRMA